MTFQQSNNSRQAECAAQTDLKESQALLHLVLEASGDGIWDWNVPGNQIHWDDASYRLLGYDPQQFALDIVTWENLIHPDDLNYVKRELMASLTSGNNLEIEFRYRNRRANWQWIQGRGLVVDRDDQGEPVRMVGIHSDITERKSAELRLRASENRLELATTAANLGIWDLDLQTGQLDWNPIMFDLYGIAQCDFDQSAATWKKALHPDDRERAVREIEKAIEQRSNFNTTFRIVHTDGDVRHIRACSRVICDENHKACRITGINMDITDQEQFQQKLRKNEEKFRNLHELAPVAVVINRLSDGLFLDGNQALYDMTGYNASEFGQLSYWDITPRKYEPQELQQLQSLQSRGTYGPFEKEYIHKDGSLIPVLLNGRLIEFEGETCIYSVIQDITAIRQTRIALERSEQRFRDVAEAAGEYIWETDHQGNYRFLTQPIEDILGRPVDEIIGRTPFEFMEPQEQERVRDFFLEKAALQESFRGLEHRSVHADGQTRWQLVSGLPAHDHNAEFLGYRGVALDITEQKHTEAQLRANASHLQAVLDNVVDGIVTIDDSGHIQSFNRSAEHIFGYAAAEVLGENVKMLMPEPHFGLHDQYLQEYHQTGIAKVLGNTRELEAQRRDGSRFPIELSVSEITQDGNTTYIGMVRDITERKRIERMKNEFVSTVSHELRTPLTSISGSLGLVLGTARDSLNVQVQDMLELAHRNSQRLGHLIDDLLDMEKIAAGKMRFDLQLQELMPIVEHSLDANRAYAEQYDVQYRLCQRSDSALVRVDDQRLMQVLSNYLSNAAKFSPAGESVDISVNLNAQGSMVRVEVKDQGPGISEDFKQRLFTKFSQADASDTRQKGGTGLGLAITKELIERMGGNVGVLSEPGQGSLFFFELPAVQREELCNMPEPADKPDDQLRALVVEDDRDVAGFLAQVLQQDSFHVDIAHTGAHAIALANQARYDVITLDLRLPDRNGVTIIRQLRTHPATAQVPIVVVSGNVEEGQLTLNGGFNAVDWLSKPIDHRQLLECVQRATSGAARKPLVLHIEDDQDTRKVISLVGQDVGIFHSAPSMHAARELLQKNAYDLVILDIGLPDGNGWDLLPGIKRMTPIPHIVVLSGQQIHPEQEHQVDRVLLKTPSSTRELVEFIKNHSRRPM